MKILEEKIKKSLINNSSELHIFDLKNTKHRQEVSNLLKKEQIVSVVDEYNTQKEELNLVKNPYLITKNQDKKIRATFIVKEGKWIFYPWNKTLVHVLDQKDFKTLRLSRNNALITSKEQERLGNSRIGIAGLNVGNPVALCMALEGIGSEMRYADNDILSLSNFNRFRASLSDLGLNKAVLSARQALEVNPYLNIRVFDKGVDPQNIQEFLLKPRVDILVEEMDNLSLKIKIRESAKAAHIPVVMVTGNGEDVILDVERYDLDGDLKILNGYLKPDILKKVLKLDPKTSRFRDRLFLARDFMGSKYLANRLKKSFLMVGSSLAGIPQLAEASFLRGALVTNVARKIILGENIKSGRYFLRIQDIF